MEQKRRRKKPRTQPADAVGPPRPIRNIANPAEEWQRRLRHPQTGHRIIIPAHVGRPRGARALPYPIDATAHFPSPPPPPPPLPAPGPLPGPLSPLVLRLQFILTTNTVSVDPTTLLVILPQVNAFFSAANISFTFDPALDYALIDSTLLDQDWRVVDPASLSNPESLLPTVDTASFHAERQHVAQAHRGKIVVFISRGSELLFDTAVHAWRVVERGFHYSSALGDYVATAAAYWRPPWVPPGIDPNTLAHELGHYFHNVHTMLHMPATVAAAAAILRDVVDNAGWNASLAQKVFDGDLPIVTDTPPDPGPYLFTAVTGSACGATGFVDVPVTFNSGASQTYRLQPDRQNLLNYFKGQSSVLDCAGSHHAKAPSSTAIGNTFCWATTIGLPKRRWRSRPTAESASLRSTSRRPRGSRCGWGMTRLPYSPGGGSAGSSWTGTQWSGWTSLGGVITSDPVLAAWYGGRLELIVRGSDGAIYHKAMTGSTWDADWAFLGGSFVGRPAMVKPAANTIEIVARSAEGAVWHKRWQQGMPTMPNRWRLLGGRTVGPPTLLVTAELSGKRRLDIFARGVGHEILHTCLNGDDEQLPAPVTWTSAQCPAI